MEDMILSSALQCEEAEGVVQLQESCSQRDISAVPGLNAPRLVDSVQPSKYVVGYEASPTDLQLRFLDSTRPRKRKASAISSDNEDYEPPKKKQRCANDFAFCAPSGFDHPPASPVLERKGKREAETLVPKVEDSCACYEKPGPEEKAAAKKRRKSMEKPTSANAAAKTSSKVTSDRMLSLRRALKCVREAAAARGARKAISVEECGEASRSRTPASSAAGADGGFALRDVPTVLHPKHKIFLSHSGAQKDFVEQLCVDLERRDIYPFFDKRRSSIPIGERFPQLLFDAIEQCEVGVVVFSEEFFTRSKWPMLELVAMTKNPKLVIIPVFLNISLEEVHDLERRKIWLSVWRGWAKQDRRLDIEEWCGALKRLRLINSLVHSGVGEVSFREKIVEAVCKIVLPETRWRDSHIQGRLRLCKVLHDKIEQARPTNGCGARLLGVYGVGGIGKTTICQALCNDYFTRMHGKVCHLELGSASNLELLHEALKKLSDKSHEVWSKLNESQCEDLWKREMQQHAIFLAIDNVSDGQESIEQAYVFLHGRFGPGSIVIVTSRSLEVLKMHHLGISENNCLEMPELEFDDAKSLFLQHAICDEETLKEVSDDLMKQFVERCDFKKSDGKSYHYHPLALKILGMQLGCTKYDMKKWVVELKVLDTFNRRRESQHPIFSVLRKSFDMLLFKDKMIFIDIALYLPKKSMGYNCNVLKWLSMVHGRHPQEVMEVLEGLKRKALIQDSGDDAFTKIGMHDLWREFVTLETRMGEFEFRRWILEVDDTNALEESTPLGGIWQHVKRMCFLGYGLSLLKSIKLDHFSNIVVLKLVAPKVNQQLNLVLDVSKLINLKSLELEMGYGRGIRVVGMRSLKNLLFLRLKDGGFSIDDMINDIGHLVNLRSLVLTYFLGDKLPDISNLIFLEEVNFSGCRNASNICGLSSRLSKLRVLILDGCEKLRNVGLSARDLQSLQELSLRSCVNLKEGQFFGMKSLQILDHSDMKLQKWMNEKLEGDIEYLITQRSLRAKLHDASAIIAKSSTDLSIS